MQTLTVYRRLLAREYGSYMCFCYFTGSTFFVRTVAAWPPVTPKLQRKRTHSARLNAEKYARRGHVLRACNLACVIILV